MAELTQEEFDELDRYEKFSKTYPFYMMDVNGFMQLVRRAMKITYKDEPDAQYYEIKHVTLDALQEAF